MKCFKKLIAGSLCALSLISGAMCLNVLADDSLIYETKKSQIITRGVTYDEITRMTKNGWLYMYALTIDANDENVDLDVIKSTSEYGLKESTLAISSENGVVAAVNGDYFGGGNPQSSMGQVIDGGQLEETQNYYNADANNYAGFFIDETGIPFVDYLKTTVGFYNSDTTVIELAGKNKVSGFSKPVYFDRQAISSTADLDKRYGSLTKIVVTEGVISYISSPGETVEVPENGYIIVMNDATRKAKIEYYAVGQPVSYVENGTFLFRPDKSLKTVDFGISGGGEILRNGETVAQGEIITPSSRSPRTCIGVSQDKSKIYILCIDGRVKGIGATTYECSTIMREMGAYDAIQLDGGGSTTMTIKPNGTEELKVVNTPSDGGQRAVANAVGIKSVGTATGLGYIEASTSAEDNVLVNGLNYNLSFKAYDDLYNPMTLSESAVTYTVEGVEGSFDGSSFTPSSEGTGKIIAHSTKGDGTEITGEFDITVVSEISNLEVQASTTIIDVGQSTKINVRQYNKDGFGGRDVDMSKTKLECATPEIGYIDSDGYFVATGTGEAVISAVCGNAIGSGKVFVGKTDTVINNFENMYGIRFLKFPENGGFSGEAGIGYGVGTSGKASLRLSYKFLPNTSSVQCAYASFPSPVSVSGTPTSLGLNVKGNNGGTIVRINIRDANNASYNVGLTDSVNFDGWQHLSGSIPVEAVYPIRVMSVYTAALSTDENAVEGTLYFDDLSANIGDYSTSAVYGFNDTYMSLENATADCSDLYVISRGVKEESLGLNGMTTSWYSAYTTGGNDNISVVNLVTDKGTLLKSSALQIRYFADYVNRLASNNIVVMIPNDMYAAGSGRFADDKEKEIFHQILKEQFFKGKNIMVVSYGGSLSSVNIKDGVRYINVSTDDSSKPVLKIKYNSNRMYYGF